MKQTEILGQIIECHRCNWVAKLVFYQGPGLNIQKSLKNHLESHIEQNHKIFA